MTFTPTTVKVVLPPKESSEPGVSTPQSVYTFEVEDLKYMEPIEAGTTTAINDILASENAIVITPIGGDLVRVTGKESLTHENVKVYDMAGREQNIEVTADSETSLTISLARLQSGAYIVNISSHSLKITKR